MKPPDYAALSAKEWLETNALGGYASGTFSGASSRRYHGLLVAATKPPTGRMVLLSKLDETLVFDGQRFELGCNQYPGVIHPTGFEYLQAFSRDLFPVFEYRCGKNVVRKTIAAIHDASTTLICYELVEGQGPLGLELRPLLSPRDHHSLSHVNASIRQDFRFQDGLLSLRPYEGVPEILIRVPKSEYQAEPCWYQNFQYERERERGLDYEEDLFCYGVFKTTLEAKKALYVIVSSSKAELRDGADLFSAEKERRSDLLKKSSKVPLAQRLSLAADQFFAKRGDGLSTVIAGYPWFTDWGRDTMISLRGLALSTGRFELARDILETFLKSLSQGMLPNQFPEGNETPQYNTVDATLWLFVAIDAFSKTGQDDAFVLKRCLPAMLDILAWHRKGTRYGIRVDTDGLLKAGEAGVQLTWMDAKVGTWVVTPRQGKAVEINALWINALRITALLCAAKGDKEQSLALEAEAARTQAAFGKAFWYAQGGYCYDVIGDEGPDASLRPNQIFCLSLPFPVLEAQHAGPMLNLIRSKLLTPRGLRSLSPDDPRYVARYEGGVPQRDGCYHQGTVWSWLLGPYIEAVVRFQGEDGKREGRSLLANFEPHLDEAGLGSVSEIFDGEAPHLPRGCIAQAWSVAELLRIQQLLFA